MTDLVYWALFVFKWGFALVGILSAYTWAHRKLWKESDK